ncbi:hypothetical protein MtrunA17_Chr7g0214301 [Medicago truncatula]|uniref:Uncharacterized protein n=1 Tax=Medicago truncatula TaxID=3880 RepID=A0A396GS69_MEDTR|nr:hypothetical protein MtrunA17_Chr7g0214301 [Medicago truncatula]
MVSFDWLQEEEVFDDIQAVSATSSDDDSSSDHVVEFEHLLEKSLDLMNNKPNRKDTEEEFMKDFVKSYPYCCNVALGYHD